jgi:hypothetical protein
VENACTWLASIATGQGRSLAALGGYLDPAMSAALEALELICRDDGPHTQVLTPAVVATLFSSLSSSQPHEEGMQEELLRYVIKESLQKSHNLCLDQVVWLCIH